MKDRFSRNGKWTTKTGYLAVLALMASFPFWAGDYNIILVSRVLCFAILALSLDLLWGYTGLLSFGHGAFFGIGAYVFGLTLKYLSFNGISYFGLFLSVLVPMVVAAILGYFLFYGRVSGIYFGIITLALTLILEALVNYPNAFEITGGQNGLYGSFLIPKFGIPGVWEYQRTLRSDFANYYTVMAGFVLAFIFCKVLVNSFLGKIMRAIKNNEDRLEFLGYNVANYKIAIFCIACGLAGFAGSLSIPIFFISPTDFGLIFSTSAIIWVAVGGRGTLLGPVIGTLLVTYLQSWLGTQFQSMWELFMGVFFVLIIIFQPDGIMGLPKRFRFRQRTTKAADGLKASKFEIEN